MNDYLKNIIQNIPQKPGCYQYYDDKGTIIYVGKAKNLKKRVSSYFTKNHHDSPKTRILVSKIRDIKYIVVASEEDTFLLENNLIKEYQPRYNVMLKDDKTYASIVIKNEYFPRILQTRNIVKDGSQYFGPYSNTFGIKVLLETIHNLYPIRTCTLNLTPENIQSGKFKVCLEYHIKRCLGPCVGLQSLEDYNKNVESIRQILKGDINIAAKSIYDDMQKHAEEFRFEEAQKLKEKYLLIENLKQKSTVTSKINYNIDVYAYDDDENAAYINYLSVHNGAIVRAYTFEFKKKLDESKEELLGLGILEMNERFGQASKEIVVPFLPDLILEDTEFTIPQRGDKLKLQKLSLLNVKQYKVDKLKRAETLNPEQRNTRIMKEIQESLQLKKPPYHIECFDNSNIQGSDPVAACVVFKGLKPSKKDYRKYIIKTVIGSDDYASMHEVVLRRYQRAINEGSPLPDLIITDGGKGQMEVVRQALEKLNISIPIAGLAKDKKHRTSELLFGFPALVVGMKQGSPLFRLMEQIQNEVHRFAITFHRKRRSKSQVKSELDNIKGIGDETKRLLLKHFRSIKRIKAASDQEIEKLVGKHKTKLLNEYFDIKKEGSDDDPNTENTDKTE